MDKAAQINSLLNRRFDKSPVQVYPALVKSVEGLTCTVTFLTNDLTIDEVRLRADVDATEGVTITPRANSLVLVAVVENDLSNLYVCQVSEVDTVNGLIGNVSWSMTKDGIVLTDDKTSASLTNSAVSIKQDQVEVSLSGGKVTIKNSGASLKGVLDDLASLLQSFQVVCAAPGAPSAAVFPATLAAVTQFKTKADLLLA